MSHFNIPPSEYDLWYETPLGKACDTIEKGLLDSFLPSPSRPPSPPGLALDIGCGTGNFTLHLAKKGIATAGVDISFENIAYLKERAERLGLKPMLVVGSAESLPFKSGVFDIAVEVTALCFVDDVPGALMEANRILKEGGVFIGGELNRASYWALLRRIKGFFRRSVYSEARFFKIKRLGKLLKKAGLLPVEHSTAIWFPPLNSSLLLKFSGFFEAIGAVFLPKHGAFIAIKAIKSRNCSQTGGRSETM